MSESAHSDDELLSSHLDGELTAEVEARLEQRLAAEPVLRDRLESMSAARALAGSPVTPLATADADAMIAAALAASDTSSNVSDLAAAGLRRRVWPQRVATVAAGVVALAVSVSVISSLGTGDADNDAGSSDSATTASAELDENFAAADDAAADFSAETGLESADGADVADEGDTGDGTADNDAIPATETGELAGDAPLADYSLSQLDLFDANVGFDPLDEDLGDYDDPATLAVALSTQWTTYRSERAIASTTTVAEPLPAPENEFTVDADLLRDTATIRFAGLGFEACPQLADLVVDHFGEEMVVGADYAAATQGGTPVAVGLFELPGGDGVGLVIDLDTCTLRSIALG